MIAMLQLLEWSGLILSTVSAQNPTELPSLMPTTAPTSVLAPDHEFDFRGCTDGIDILDTYNNSIYAQAVNGAICSEDGMLFDGVDDFVDIAPWLFGGVLTIEAYLKLHSVAVSNLSWVVDFADGASDNQIALGSASSTDDFGFTFFHHDSESDSYGGFTAGNETLDIGTYVHVVATVDNTYMKGYKNGKIIQTDISYSGVPDVTKRANHWLGRNQQASLYFNGTIAYVRFWHGVALNDNQVQDLYLTRITPTSIPTALPTFVPTYEPSPGPTTAPFSTASLRNAVSLWCSDRTAATLNHGPINMWDTSRVTNMSHLFGAGGELVPWEEDDDDDLSPGVYCYNNSFFDDDVSRWDTSRVTDMSWMFFGASAFNGNISFWNISLVTNMRGMFARASSFNQSLNYWQGQSLQFALICTLNALASCAATFRFLQ